MKIDYAERAEILTILASSNKTGEELLLEAYKPGRSFSLNDKNALEELKTE